MSEYLIIRASSLLIFYTILDRLMAFAGRLPQASYEQPVISIELSKRLLSLLFQPFLFFGLVLILILGIFLSIRYSWLKESYPRFWHGWSIFDSSTKLRWFIILVALILAWSFATYNYNYFFNQGHYLDRILLVGLVSLIYWKPVFVFPFTLLIISIIGQFDYPLGGYSWADPDLLIRLLILFMAMFLLYVLTGYCKTADFLFLVCCLVASHYWIPGLAKLKLNWLTDDHLYFNLPNSYANGWLAFCEPTAIASFTQTLSWFDGLLKLATILLECGLLFCFWRRTVLRFFLIGWIFFHLGIFVITGICFWKWMALDAILFLLFFRKGQVNHNSIFTPAHFRISLVLILSSNLWLNPIALAWYDAPITYTYRFVAIGESGQSYTLSPRFFAPYDYQFTIGGFHYLSSQPTLNITSGATRDRNLIPTLIQAKSLNQIEAIEAQKGKSRFYSKKANQFDNFIQEFVGHGNERRYQGTRFTFLQPPPLLWTFSRGKAFRGQERIAKIIINQVLSRYDDGKYQEIRTNKVRSIEIRKGIEKGIQEDLVSEARFDKNFPKVTEAS